MVIQRLLQNYIQKMHRQFSAAITDYHFTVSLLALRNISAHINRKRLFQHKRVIHISYKETYLHDTYT